MADGLQILNSSGNVVVDTSKSAWSVLTNVVRGEYDPSAPLHVKGVFNYSGTTALLIINVPRLSSDGSTTISEVFYYRNDIEVGRVTKYKNNSTGAETLSQTGVFVKVRQGDGPPIPDLCGNSGPTSAVTYSTFNFSTNNGTSYYYLICEGGTEGSPITTPNEYPLVSNSYSYRSNGLDSSTVQYPIPGWEVCSEVIVSSYNIGASDPSSQKSLTYQYSYSQGLLSTFNGNTPTLFTVLGR